MWLSFNFISKHSNQASVFANSDAVSPRALTYKRSGELGCTQGQYLCRGSLPLAAVAWPCFSLPVLFTMDGTLWSLCMLTCNHWVNSGPWNRWFFFPHCLFYYATHICCLGSRQRVKLSVCVHSQSLRLGLWMKPPWDNSCVCLVPTFQFSFVPLSLREVFYVAIFHEYSGD